MPSFDSPRSSAGPSTLIAAPRQSRKPMPRIETACIARFASIPPWTERPSMIVVFASKPMRSSCLPRRSTTCELVVRGVGTGLDQDHVPVGSRVHRALDVRIVGGSVVIDGDDVRIKTLFGAEGDAPDGQKGHGQSPTEGPPVLLIPIEFCIRFDSSDLHHHRPHGSSSSPSDHLRPA